MNSLPATARRSGPPARFTRATAKSLNRHQITPFDIRRIKAGTYETIPDPIEFIVSDRYLDRPNLYPRQATFIKIVFLRDDLFTQYDLDVIEEWENAFAATGTEGISPGIMDRIRVNKTCPCGHMIEDHLRRRGACLAGECECSLYGGRPWFREAQAVVGRRGSKGYVGGLCTSYVTWNYMHRPGGPQNYYGIDRDKRLTGIVFAGKKEQAKANQWQDIVNVILGAPCFSRYISTPQTERLTIECPNDWLRQMRMRELGVVTDTDTASFEIIPAPSTTMAARGPTSFFQAYDEQAHVINSTSNADAEAVYNSATPSLDQFKKDGFIYAPSSPWTKTGQFFMNWELSIEMESNGKPTYPERVMLQLPSWGLYEDWDQAHRIPLRPLVTTTREEDRLVKKRKKTSSGKSRTISVMKTFEVEYKAVDELGHFRPLKQAIQAFDDDMRQLQRANPDTFKVERLSHWAESLDAYMNPEKVAQVFQPWRGQTLLVQKQGILRETYSAHGDPSTSNKRFGWSMGHRVWVPDLDENGKPDRDGYGAYHVVFDRIRCWDPVDYPDHILDYDDVMESIWAEDVVPFVPEDVSFDQFNVPATVGTLRKKVAKEQLPKQVRVHEVTRTAPLNWKHYEMFKSAINMGWVHAPMLLPEIDDEGEHEVNFASSEAELELKFLEEKNGKVNHPTTGPVQTKDIADSMCEVTVQLIGKQMAQFLGMELDDISVSGGAPLGTDPGRRTNPTSDVAERLGALTDSGGMGRGMQPGNLGTASARGQRGMRRR
jgi:hypothetical protein